LVASATPESGSALEREQGQEQEQEQEQEEGHARSSSRSTGSGGAGGRALFYFFGREVARAPSRDKFSLKRRAFLGPTSMECDMAFLMANQGLARPGALIMDPFVGTGSVLVPCAQLGAVCFGGDIDYVTLRGKNGATAFDSFDQLGLPRPDLLRLDFSPKGRCVREPAGGLLDAIVCDPPYGIRAGARKVGSSKQRVTPIPEEHRDGHFAQTQVYETSELMVDLVDAAARLLRLGGRLVYLLPVVRKSYTPDCVPAHSCLELVANCEQRMSGPVSRRLITMHKVRPYDYAQAAAYVSTGRAQLAVPTLDELDKLDELDELEGPGRAKP
jgi:tRNA (guanine10-N2)-methyltransferase